jgi:hypothetical protein
MDIYQRIWDADQAGSGIQALLPGQPKDPQRGYVVVDEKREASPQHHLMSEFLIPDAKAKTYLLARRLFNNYTLDQTKRENDKPEESDEVHDLLDAIVQSPPMDVARQFIEEQSGARISPFRFYQMLHQVWFTRFDSGENYDLSGFEHIVIGEQKEGKVQGYHFWYKYLLDDGLVTTEGSPLGDHITYMGAKDEGPRVPECVTIAYKWDAFDYESGQTRPLIKPIGGFFVGPSIEGLMALVMARFALEARAPKQAIINSALYNLQLYRSPSGRELRTCYPEFVRVVGDNEASAPAPAPPQPAPPQPVTP